MLYHPYGYKQLLTWRQAGEIYARSKLLTAEYLNQYKDSRLIGHINDSARSGQRNIEEGYKRGNTKAYLEFLGFSRASLEELKRDLEELKRELEQGLRWNDKDKNKDYDDKDEIRRELDQLITLVYGEDCMLGRQIKSLEIKLENEGGLSQNQKIRQVWKREKEGEERFWKIAKEQYGIYKDEKGLIRTKKDK